MYSLFDTHCHLDFAVFDADRRAVLNRANQVGVSHIMIPATTRTSWQNLLSIASEYDLHAALGLHPYFIDAHQPSDLDYLQQCLTEQPPVRAIGECGIDKRFPETLSAQWHYFEAQVQLANRLSLPIIVHCVKAHEEMLSFLRETTPLAGGIIHAYSGSYEQAKRYSDLGFKLGMGGALTHLNAKKVRHVASQMPIESLVLETDSPDMPVVQQTETRNEPANLLRVASVLAELRQVTVSDVAEQTTQNAKKLYRV